MKRRIVFHRPPSIVFDVPDDADEEASQRLSADRVAEEYGPLAELEWDLWEEPETTGEQKT